MSMTNRDVVNKILAYHPQTPGYHGCDDWKAGNPDDECRGIATALVPTVEVIKKTAELGANLLIVHEPTFYTSLDEAGWFEDFGNSVYEDKKKLLEETGITIWRDHDHLHMHNPDGIFTGVLKYMGWADYARTITDTGLFSHFYIDLPEETTVRNLCLYIKEKLGLNGLRYIGNPDSSVKKIAFVGHLYPMPMMKKGKDGRNLEYSVQIIRELEEEVDVIIPGEIIEWTVMSYVRDAVQQGKNKAAINLGHFNWEELGMKYAKDWIDDLVKGEVPVTYVPGGDTYNFI
jgi:putative NIF3 family GTP cyclohydrolase 1 type 2